jgi:hypothetical protein
MSCMHWYCGVRQANGAKSKNDNWEEIFQGATFFFTLCVHLVCKGICIQGIVQQVDKIDWKHISLVGNKYVD